MFKTTIKHSFTVIKSKSYRSSIEETNCFCISRSSQALPVYLRGSVEIEAAFVLDVEHQVASIQVLHYKEEVLLWKTTHYCQLTVSDKWDMKSVWDRMDSDKGG